MRTLGTLPQETFDRVCKILKERFPGLQVENSPAIVLEKYSNTQLIAMEGYYKRGSYEVLLLEIRSPDADHTAIQPVTEQAYDRNQKVIEDALKTALTQ